MENDRIQNGEPSYLRLKRLMETRMSSIVSAERHNGGSIRLYCTGGWWVAFERSAYGVCRLFPQSRVNVAVNPDTRVPVVMTGISDEQLQSYGRQHDFLCDTPDYKEFPVSEIPPAEYSDWRRSEVEKFAPALALLGDKAGDRTGGMAGDRTKRGSGRGTRHS